jgi:putative NIF3 family GTP cyclohydrolase 1 type 2
MNGVTMMAMHTPVDVTDKVTALAAFATRTHLRVLARYMNIADDLVQVRLRDSLEKWCAIGGIPLPE